MKQILLFSLSLIILLSSCTSQKSVQSSAEVTKTFTESQSKLIHKDGIKTPMRILQITDYKDSIILRTKSQPIDLSSQKETTKTLANRLLTTVNDPKNPGVGIAAPQVGILKQMIAVQRFDKKGNPFEIYINPVIKQYSVKTQFCLEGCLSIPDKMDTTKNRAYAILLEYDKMDGSHTYEMIEAFTAVIFQHEIDHLNGILFTDHLDIEIEEAEERKRKENE